MRLVFLAFVAACDSGAVEPRDAGSAVSDAGAILDAGTDAGLDAGASPFVAVYDLLHARNCIYPCHDRTANGRLSLSTFDGLPARNPDDDLDFAYRALGQAAGSPFCAGEDRVVEGDPGASLLIKKVQSGPAPCGSRMPGSPYPRLSLEDVEVLRTWIANGALF
jgi:hypothetical protein